MPNELENFVQQNRENFDTFEPSSNVWNNINKEIKKPKVISMKFVRYAAAVAIFAFGFTFGNYNKNSHNIEIETPSKNSAGQFQQTKLIESEFYYNTKINNKLIELKPYFASDPKLKQDLEVDFNELDDFYLKLKADLNQNINNEHVIEAMIQSYQMKLEILESLLQQLKDNNHEDIKYDV